MISTNQSTVQTDLDQWEWASLLCIMKYTEENDVVRDAIEEAVRDGEERDGGVETEVG